MASIQTTQHISNSRIERMDSAGLLSLTMTALRLHVPWIKPSANTSDPIITLDDVSWHDQSNDCWIIIYDRVYDITKFLKEHPGGADVLLEYAGRDATIAFRGTGHSRAAIAGLCAFYIGQLPLSECIYRKPGGINLSDLPI